ncbi:hypothetical protein E4U58_007378 [Claviceps cyperi]|nr:hypothetical protein E4U58_007378 [Claviceps cyperi]
MPGHKPIRLPPLKVLRVKDPKRQVETPCIAIMSNVLGIRKHANEKSKSLLLRQIANCPPLSMLGLLRPKLRWLRANRGPATEMYGWAEATASAAEYDQLPPGEDEEACFESGEVQVILWGDLPLELMCGCGGGIGRAVWMGRKKET